MKFKLLSFTIIGFLLISGVLPSMTSISTKETNILDGSDSSCYGFIISVNSSQSNDLQMGISKLVNELLKNDIEVYWITNQINVSSKILDENSSVENNYFEKGSYIVLFVSNQSINAKITNIVYKYHIKKLVSLHMLMESINNIEVYKLVEPKIAIHNGPSVEAYPFTKCLREGGFLNYDFISYDEIPNKLNNDDFNVFIWGGGVASSSILKNTLNFVYDGTHKNAILSIKEFVNSGGGYVGACSGQYAASKNVMTPCIQKGLINSNVVFKSDNYLGCNYTTQYLKEMFLYRVVFPSGMVLCKIKNFNNPVVYGLNDYIPMAHYTGPLPKICGEDVETIAVFHNITESNPSTTPEILKKMFNRQIKGTPNIISTKIGKGKAVTFSSHPEKYYAIEKYPNYTAPVRLVYNSVFYVTSKGPLTTNIKKCMNFSNFELEINSPSSANVSDLIELQCNVNNGTSPYTYLWNFDDGTTSIVSNPVHQYLDPGEFSIILSVIDNNSDIDVGFLEINISGKSVAENRPPEKPVGFYGNERIGGVREAVHFNFKTMDPDGDLFWYKTKVNNNIKWENFTKYMICESNQSFEFWIKWQELEMETKTGIYILEMRAVDMHGAESEWSDPIEVTVTRHPFISRIFKR